MFKKIILKLIKLYQHTLSPDHSWLRFFRITGTCKFYPTCSDYTYQGIEKYGILKGTWLGIKRIFRCHPFSSGGIDEIK
jgi:putative membrane protein insertion efficiency factor